MKKTKDKQKLPEKLNDRMLVYGVHPEDLRTPKKVYTFWASEYLMGEYPCVGDLVTVRTSMIKKNGKPGIKITTLYVTDLKMWEEGDAQPTATALSLYRGKHHRDFTYEIDSIQREMP